MSIDKKRRMLASDLGERRIIELIRENLDIPRDMPLPFGDDASAVLISDDLAGVLKTDMLVGKTDIPPTMSIQQAARKAVVMNVSDFAAKGVRPLAVLAAIGLPSDTTLEQIVQIGRGLNQGATEYGTYVVGGDTNEADDLIISCSIFGVSRSDFLVRRSGAQVGDIVAVTGPFGNTAAGLKILLENKRTSPDIEEKILESIYMPRAQLEIGTTLAENHLISAAIDSSDGLARCLFELASASNVGFKIESIPVSTETEIFAESQALNPEELALYGGEEYELVFTTQPEKLDEIMHIAERKGIMIIPIGRVETAETGIVVKTEGEEQTLAVGGWEHFSGQ